MDINVEESRRLLVTAIKNMDVPMVRLLILKLNVKPLWLDIASKDMFDFIRKVALFNDKPLLRGLLRYNSELGGKVLWTVLNNIELAKTLVKAGAALNVGQYDAAMHFVSRKWVRAIPNKGYKSYQPTFLHVLIANKNSKNLELADLMLRHGANANAIDENCNSVLKCAIKAGISNDFIEKLLNKNVHYFGRDVFTIAESDRTADLIPLIITSGARDESVKRDRACHAMFCLINSHPVNMDAIEGLFEYGISIDELDYKGDTALHNAVIKAVPNLVEFLLKRNADLNKKTSKGLQPLWIALTLKESVISSLLIKYGADIHCPNKNGQRPIHVACKSGSMNNIFLLIRLGVDINVTDRKGLTPFSLLFDRLESSSLHINIGMSVEDAFFVRQLALAAFRGVEFSAWNMRLIESSASLHELYALNFSELQRMQRLEVDNGIPYYTFLIGSVWRTSSFTRREDFANAFENLAMLRDLFPSYFYDLRNAYVLAKERENHVIANERLLDEIITEVYQISLPYLVIKKIANYLCFDDKLFCTLSNMIWE